MDVQEISEPAQFKALAHPLRHRLLFALGVEPATVSQLAVAFGLAKGSVAHHLKVLREAGLVRESGTRQVRGGTERYFARTGRVLRFSGSGAEANAVVTLQAVAEEVATARLPRMGVRTVRLTAAQAEELAERFAELLSALTDAGEDAARYGVAYTVYQPGSASAAPPQP